MQLQSITPLARMVAIDIDLNLFKVCMPFLKKVAMQSVPQQILHTRKEKNQIQMQISYENSSNCIHFHGNYSSPKSNSMSQPAIFLISSSNKADCSSEK